MRQCSCQKSQMLCSYSHSYVWQELLTGGDLFSYLAARGTPGLTDAESAIIVRQLLEAIRYLHANDIVHRDIKPENILLASRQPDMRIVLCDFGYAKKINTASADAPKRLHTMVGTFEFAAPEIFLGARQHNMDGYEQSVDLWSVGAVTAVLLTGESVSETLLNDAGRQEVDLAKKLERNPVLNVDHYDCQPLMRKPREFTTPATSRWSVISSQPKDFVKCCLDTDASRRMTAQQALQHKWLNKSTYRDKMDRIYRQAIADWEPAASAAMDVVDTTSLGPAPLDDCSVLDNYLEQAEQSRHFCVSNA